MPANALQVESREFTEFTAQETGSGVNVSGEYTVTVSNTGVLPAPSTTVTVNALEISGNTLIEEETEAIGRVSGGQEGSASFEFEFQSSSIPSFVNTACGGNETSAEVDELIGGLLLAISTEDEVSIQSPLPSCNISGGGGSPEPQPDPDPDPEPEPEPEPDPDPEPPEVVNLEVEGATDPLEDLDNTYRIDNEPDAASRYVWNSNKFDPRTTSDDEITVTFEEPGEFQIVVEARNNRDQTVGEGSINGEVLAQTGGGGDGEEDDGSTGGGGTCEDDLTGESLGSTDASDGEIASASITSTDVSGSDLEVQYDVEGLIFSGGVEVKAEVAVIDTATFDGSAIVRSSEVHDQFRDNESYTQTLDVGCIDGETHAVRLSWEDSTGNEGTDRQNVSFPSTSTASGLPSMTEAADMQDKEEW